MTGLSPLAEALLAIKQALLSTWNELGWLYSNMRTIDGYPNNPDATINITERLHHISAGLTCIYIFAILEEFINPRSSEWNDFLDILRPEDKQKLKAFKHIRNTIAHGFDGTRANRDADKFDCVMSRQDPSERIQAVTIHNSNTIKLSHFAGLECYQFVSNVVDYALQRALNPGS